MRKLNLEYWTFLSCWDTGNNSKSKFSEDGLLIVYRSEFFLGLMHCIRKKQFSHSALGYKSKVKKMMSCFFWHLPPCLLNDPPKVSSYNIPLHVCLNIISSSVEVTTHTKVHFTLIRLFLVQSGLCSKMFLLFFF